MTKPRDKEEGDIECKGHRSREAINWNHQYTQLSPMYIEGEAEGSLLREVCCNDYF